MRPTKAIGGHHLGVAEQFWWAVVSLIKDSYPINGVPKDIEVELASLVQRAQDLCRDGAQFLERLPAEVEP